MSFVCNQCGLFHSKWSGKCEGCGEWNTITQEVSKRTKSVSSDDIFHKLSDVKLEETERLKSDIEELDRVCGGGLVRGSVILVGGSPGIGKSTLMLQLVSQLSQKTLCAYVSGEEGLAQIKLRAERLKVKQDAFVMSTCTNILDLINVFEKTKGLGLVVIDSVQTMQHPSIDGAPGSVSQIKAIAQTLVDSAKRSGYTVMLIGHVTKEGTLAGPRLLEHMVDAVLYFDGEGINDYRILRTVKNRFGTTNEIGVFTMTQKGLEEVTNPSSLFLSDPNQVVSGTAIVSSFEGTRSILCEIQALIVKSSLAMPRRVSIGYDANRLSMLTAVLQSRCKLSFWNQDIYLNVAGGLQLKEPATDLGVAAALISALKGQPNNPHAVYFGEIALSGQVKPATHTEVRLKEVKKIGLKQAFCNYQGKIGGLSVNHIAHIKDLH